jgi:hypothetical protein
MEKLFKMTMTALDRTLVAGDAGRTSGRSAPIRRCLRRLAGGRSSRSTSGRSWPPTFETRVPWGDPPAECCVESRRVDAVDVTQVGSEQMRGRAVA